MVFPLPRLIARGYFPITPMAKASRFEKAQGRDSHAASQPQDVGSAGPGAELVRSKWIFSHKVHRKNQDEPYQKLRYHIFRQIHKCSFLCADFIPVILLQWMWEEMLQIGGPIICFSCRALHSEGASSWKENHFVVAMPQCP